MILQTPNAESPWGLYYRYGDFTHETAFTPSLLTYLLSLCGFQDIKVREMEPVPWGYSPISTIRYFLWKIIRLFTIVSNLVETGSPGSGVLTRVFCITGIKAE